MPKLSTITRPSGASTSTHINGLCEERVPERRKFKTGTRLVDGSGKGEPGDQPGQRYARGHVVVDTDHVGAQTRVDRYLGPVAGPGGGDIPVEVGHGGTPWLPRHSPGWRPQSGRR